MNFAKRFVQLVFGLFLYGIGISLMVRAALGIAPWDVLTQGIARQSGWSFGLLTNVIGAVVLLLWWPIRQKPGLGTVLNVLLIGPSAQFGLWLFPEFGALPAQVAAFAAGMGVLALATGLYIGADFGPGPRDGLMTGLHRRTGWPIWAVRTGIEAAVLALGWWLGGNAGLGHAGLRPADRADVRGDPALVRAQCAIARTTGAGFARRLTRACPPRGFPAPCALHTHAHAR